MRLKKIKLAGFKSFVDITTIPFDGALTAIVGPNGCGKSNVIDAVRWVLGESSAKNLRGDAMTDVIFNGSAARKPVQQCSVELVFDNSSGRIQGEYANYNELSVKRLVNRDAQSFYFLNSQKCRRRDITDLFLGTGLGPRSYAIIEQGMISRLIESKPQELRIFIEEAAGISKYKERRKETRNRISHTEDNLARLHDVQAELSVQIDKLQRQANAAERYRNLKKTERELIQNLAIQRFMQQQQHMETSQQQIAELETQLDDLSHSDASRLAQIDACKATISALQTQLETRQHEKFSVGNDITRLEQDERYAEEKKQRWQSQLVSAQAETEENQSVIATLDEQLLALNADLEIMTPQLDECAARYDELLLQQQAYEEQLQQQQQHFQQDSQRYYQQKEQVASCHAKLQANIEQQNKLSAQLAALQLQSNDSSMTADEVSTSAAELANLETELQQLHQQQQQVDEAYQQALSQQLTLQQRFADSQSRWQGQQAQLSAMSAIQASQTHNLPETLQQALTPMWQTLQIDDRYGKLFELVFFHLNNPYVTQMNLTQLAPQLRLHNGLHVRFAEEFVSDVKPHSLATAIIEGRFPGWLNDIGLLTVEANLTITEQFTLAYDLMLSDDFASVITTNGFWFERHALLTQADDAQIGQVERAHQIEALRLEIQSLAEQNAELQTAKETQDKLVNTLRSEQQSLQAQNQRTQQSLQTLRQQYQEEQEHRAQVAAQHANLHSQISQLEAQLDELQVNQEELNEMVYLAEDALAELQMTHEQQQHQQLELEGQVTQIKQRQQALLEEKHRLNLQRQEKQHQYDLSQQQHARAMEQREQLVVRIAQAQQGLTEIMQPEADKKRLLAEQLAHFQSLEDDILQSKTKLTESQQQLKDLELVMQEKMQVMQTLQAKIQAEQLQLEGYKVRANAIVEEMQRAEVSFKAMLSDPPEQVDIAQLEQQLSTCRNSIQRLGAVNLAAIDEYQEQAERKSKLDAQQMDLAAALSTLNEAMQKIDQETKRRFKKTFDQVNSDLQMLFPKVFGGGNAYLALTDDDILETGVTIMARPPGKKNSTIHLLSGGEKALTALSLVFAIFRLNPAPFCLLDEVDAPLDDANVGRFCKLVQEMSKTVQFIYISHNKIAMEMATHLTGVTMAEPGVSRMVAVDIEEAMSYAQ